MAEISTYKLSEYIADLPKWRYQFFPLNTPHELFGDFASILSMYYAKGQGNVPNWRDMDFYDFVGWHGRVSLHQVLENPFRLKVRLFGTTFTDYYEQDWTGLVMDDNSYSKTGVDESDLLIKEDFEFFHHVAKEQVIGVAFGPAVWLDKEFKHYTTICLPLVDAAGQIDKLLNVIIASTADEPLLEV